MGRPRNTANQENAERGIHALKIDTRREKIMDALERNGQVSIAQLAELLNTTTVTIRSDLDAMEEDGQVERVPGGAILTTMSMYSREFIRRKRMNTDAKRLLAKAIVDEIEDGDTIFINGGSTTYFAALRIKKLKKNLIIVTNSISVAIELGSAPTFTVILVGGQINSYFSFTYGTEALTQIRQYQVKKAIISIDGIDEQGITTIHPEESTIAATMIERAKKSIVLADSSKIGRDGFCTICSLDRVNKLITNSDADEASLRYFRESGVEVSLV